MPRQCVTLKVSVIEQIFLKNLYFFSEILRTFFITAVKPGIPENSQKTKAEMFTESKEGCTT